MKRILAILLLAALVGCTSETAFGPCIGAFDERDPALVYKVSVWNAFLGIFFAGTVIVPVVVVANATLCPEYRRATR